MTHSLSQYKRIVVKIGSALLVDRGFGVRRAWMESLAQDIAGLAENGCEFLLVSSGAIALGRTLLKLPDRPLKLDENQAAAAAGQIELGRAWSEVLSVHNITAGQILLTLGDTEGQAGRRSYLNARSTMSTLIGLGAIPIINENDTIATSEIRYGDNDRLAARVATMMSANLLVLLSDVDGLYSAPPESKPDARFIPLVENITPEIEAMAGSAGSELSRGGMVTKIEAAKIATTAGTTMVITSGKTNSPLARLENGSAMKNRATWFTANQNPVAARKKWIAGQLEVKGSITVDEGARRALNTGKSLLPAGVIDVVGSFTRGDAVSIVAANGNELGRGLSGYDTTDARAIMGKKSGELAAILGFEGRAELIHRDDMALGKNAADGASTASDQNGK